MSQITKFTPAVLDKLRSEIDSALGEVSKKYGITMKLGRITYSADTFAGKVSAAIVGDNVENDEEALYAAELGRSGYYYGMDKSMYGRLVPIYGKTYKVVGLRRGARTKPLIMRNMADNKMYRFPIDPYVELIKKANV
jgi:hypothetical protein